jgi:asparagine synthetase B (glutamine-hydrolysing)
MCGQAGIHRRGDREIPEFGRLVDELLLSIEPRGQDATGMLAMLDSGKVQVDRRTVTASKFVEKRKRFSGDARTVLLHTRFATIGGRKNPLNVHPQGAGTIAATHNGTIWNANELFKAFELPRIATVDSEVIPALVNYAGWDQMEDAFNLMEGGAAIALINTEHPEEVVLARLEGFPLCYATTQNAVIWASSEKALREAWLYTYGKRLRAKVHHLAEGEMARVNGTVKVSGIAGWKPRVKYVPKAWQGDGGYYSGEPKTTKKKRKKKRKKKASVPPITIVKPTGPTYEPPPLRHNTIPGIVPDGDELVDVLVLNGWSRAAAEWEVYGDWMEGEATELDTSGMSPATRALYELD